MSHLKREDRERLEVLRSGVQLVTVPSEHRADEIAAQLHTEAPWMAPATEIVWHAMRRSVREGAPGLRLPPLLLDGPPGIGKSHWSRRLGALLTLSTTVVEATSESASFGLTGSQREWDNAQPGRLIETILRNQIANPLVVIDELEKAGAITSSKGHSYGLANSLLPLLETLTSRRWNCPYTFAFGTAMGAFFVFFSAAPRLLIERAGYGEFGFSLAFATVAVVMIMVSRFAASFVDRWGVPGCACRGLLLMLVGALLLLLGHLILAPSALSFIIPMWLVAVGIVMIGSVTANGALAEFGEIAGIAVALHFCVQSLIVGVVGTAFVVMLGGDTALPLFFYIAVMASASFVWVNTAAKLKVSVE